jgi:hypothetical protein
MATLEPSWPARSPLPILRPRQARPVLESEGLTSLLERLVGEKRLGIDEQSEDQPCHGTISHLGVE